MRRVRSLMVPGEERKPVNTFRVCPKCGRDKYVEDKKVVVSVDGQSMSYQLPVCRKCRVPTNPNFTNLASLLVKDIVAGGPVEPEEPVQAGPRVTEAEIIESLRKGAESAEELNKQLEQTFHPSPSNLVLREPNG